MTPAADDSAISALLPRVLAAAPSASAWGQALDLLARIDDAAILSHACERVARRTHNWPLAVRTAHQGRLRHALEHGGPDPRLRLAPQVAKRMVELV